MQSVGCWVAKGAWCTTNRGGSAHRVTSFICSVFQACSSCFLAGGGQGEPAAFYICWVQVPETSPGVFKCTHGALYRAEQQQEQL